MSNAPSLDLAEHLFKQSFRGAGNGPASLSGASTKRRLYFAPQRYWPDLTTRARNGLPCTRPEMVARNDLKCRDNSGPVGETRRMGVVEGRLVELRGIEPLTSAVRLQRSPI